MDDTSRFYDFTMLISSAYKLLRRAQEKYTRLFGLRGEASPGEKRRYRGRLRLTEAGARKAEAMNALVAEKLNAVAGDLNPYDVQTFYKVLRQINERLEGV